MKKTTKKKLTLHRETLTQLTDSTVQNVAGGTDTNNRACVYTVIYYCPSTPPMCP